MALRTLSGRQMALKYKEGEFPEGEIPALLDQLLYAPAIALRAEFAQSFRKRLADKKRERGILAFDDQLRRLQGALLDPERAAVLREVIQKDYRAALIDESQDTDAVQWSIFSQLFGSQERPLYLIGDPKQAIYSFRGADVATYLEARAEAGEQRYGLDTNWRSDAPLVQALNALYGAAPRLAEGIEVPAVKAAPGHEESALSGGEHLAPLLIRHFPADYAGLTKKAEWSGNFPAATKMAATTGAELEHLLNSGMQLRDEDGELRSLHAGDIAVIVDTHHQAQTVEAALQARGLPCVRTGHGSVFESEAAAALSIWLDAVASTRARGSARALLVGPLVGLSPRQLDELDELELEDWDESFARWRERWHKSGFLAAWKSCEDELDLHAKTLARAGGARFWTDLRQLVGLLHEAETSARLAPAALIRWFARWPEGDAQVEDAHALRLDRDDDAITITTLHASKGLEYGVVVCPTAWNGPRKIKGTNLRVRVPDHDPPWVLDLRDEALDEGKARNLEHAELAQSEEQARKLYVALTRAKHQLIVYWGAFESSENSALARLLFPELGPAALRALDDAERLNELGRLAERLGEGVELVDADELDQPVSTTSPTPVDVAALSRRSFSRPKLDRDWRRASYSSLSRAAHFQALVPSDQVDDASPEADGIDHDQFVDPALGSSDDPPSADGAQVPLAAFERGAAAGTYLHELLEILDFQHFDDRAALVEACEAGIERHRLTRGTGALVARGLHAAVHTPLGGPLGDWSLAQLTRGDRVDEMQFDLPLAGGYRSDGDHAVARDGIARLFAEHREACGPLPQRAIDHYASMQLASPLRGFLTGAIDLFFRAPDGDGQMRYFVADYKSNWLGAADRKRSTLAHYHPDAGRGHAAPRLSPAVPPLRTGRAPLPALAPGRPLRLRTRLRGGLLPLPARHGWARQSPLRRGAMRLGGLL
jgi:exodeoxyribonuclease V beta subunit